MTTKCSIYASFSLLSTGRKRLICYRGDATFKATPQSHQLGVDMERFLLPPGFPVAIAGAYLKSENVSRSASDFRRTCEPFRGTRTPNIQTGVTSNSPNKTTAMFVPNLV